MKIVHCLDHYLPRHTAGTEYYVHHLAKKQAEMGDEVAVVVPFFEYYYKDEAFQDSYHVDNIKIYHFRESGYPATSPQGLERFLSLIKQLNPAVVHIHAIGRSIGFSQPHLAQLKKHGFKTVLTFHQAYSCHTNTLYRDERLLCNGIIEKKKCVSCSIRTNHKMPLLLSKTIGTLGSLPFSSTKSGDSKIRKLLNYSHRIEAIIRDLTYISENVDQVISLTDWYKQILIANGVKEDKISVIKQGLMQAQAKSKHNTTVSSSSPLKLVFVGRLQPQKGLHLLMDAMACLKNEAVVLDVYGKEEDTVYWQQCKKKIDASQNIQYKGLIRNAEVGQVLSNYHLLVLPSTFSEMSPLVIQEAFAAGLPVLGSDVYGIAEQIKNGNGWLFKMNDSKSLANTIRKILADKTQVIEKAKSFPTLRTFSAIAVETKKVYQQIA